MNKLVTPEYYINLTTDCVSVMFLIQLSFLILREEMRCFKIACRFIGNPLEEKHSAEGDWRGEATRRLSRLKKLDGKNLVSSVLVSQHYPSNGSLQSLSRQQTRSQSLTQSPSYSQSRSRS